MFPVSPRVSALLVTCALLAVGLAGCIEGGDELTAAEGADVDEGPVEVSAGEALLKGRVLNDGLEPAEGATVIEKATGLNTTSDADGRYRLAGLTPGAQAIVVQAPGHAPITEEIELVEGEATVKDFMIQRVRGATPYHQVFEQSGLLECQKNLGRAVANCVPIQNLLNQLGTNPTNTKQVLKWHVAPVEGLELVRLELVWEPTALTTTDHLLFMAEPDLSQLSGGQWGQVEGPSVLTIDITGENLTQLKENATEDKPYQTRVWPPRGYEDVVYMQKFTIFASHFYYSLPSDDYSGVPDGYVP